MNKVDYVPLSCGQCREGAGLDFDFSFAFQPIVDIERRRVYSYEALVRGPEGEPAFTVLGRVNDQNRYRFDQACRVKVIQLAARLGVSSYLNINFMPGAVYRPELCIRTTLEAAREINFPLENIIFEVVESETVDDHAHLTSIIQKYQELGFKTAIDDFGEGYSGLNLLAEYQPDMIKLDMKLIRNIHENRPRQVIVKAIVQVCHELGIGLIAEGIEVREEAVWLRDAGITLMQGYYFARPQYEQLPQIPAECYSF